MAKARRRTQAQRVEARKTRELQGTDARLLETIEAAIAEQQRRRFFQRLGCPVGPLPS